MSQSNIGPVDTGRSLPIALLRTREAVMSHFRPYLAEHKLTEQQWRVLRVLEEQGALDFTQVAEQACLLRPSLTRISKTLVEDGYLRTFGHAQDKRRTLIEITEQGRALIQAMAPQSREIYAGLEEKIGKEEMDSLLSQLEQVLSKLASD